MRARIEHLLSVRASPEAGQFLASPTASSATGSTAAVPLPGTEIGPYRLLEQIGEGGFGVVYLAEQREPVTRRVALKVIKVGMDTRQVIARFEAERQALAMMDHPNIAHVIDAGATTDGRPFFVMELVPGEAITGYCDRQHLTIDERLSLFSQVCSAVQHAHTKGIIHRDLKPGNVLVAGLDGRPSVKVIDFGIAKATGARLTEKTLFTDHRQFIGTPEYMSPEQATGAGDVDTRSDVYSLGILLYELLTGATPFDSARLRSAAYGEIQRIIREDEPPKPSTRLSTIETLASVAASRRMPPGRLARLIRGDLDWIVMKCLEKDRSRRYGTASALAEDLARHLRGEPVMAGPPSRLYRLGRFVRRNRLGVAAAALLILTLLAGLAGTTTFAVREARQRVAAEENASRIRQVADFQARMLEGLDAGAMGRQVKALLREQVRIGLEHRLVGEGPGRHPPSPEEIAADLAAYDQRASLAQGADVARGVMDEQVLGRASEAAAKEFADQPLVLAQVRDAIGSTYRALGLYERAEAEHRAALEARVAVLGETDLLVAGTLSNLADALLDLGEYDRAEAANRRALAARRTLLGEGDPLVAASENNIAAVYFARGDYASAEPLYRAALAVLHARLGDEDPDTLACMHSLASVLCSMGSYAEAEPLFREVLEHRRKVFGEESLETANTLDGLASVLRRTGNYAEAQTLLEEVLKTRRAILGDEHKDTASALTSLALVLEHNGRAMESEAMYRQALEVDRRRLGDSHPEVAIDRNNLGLMLLGSGRATEAEPLLQDAVEIERGAQQGESPMLAACLHHLAGAQLNLGKTQDAERLAAESVAMYRHHPEWNPGEFRHALSILSAVYAKLGREDEAGDALVESVEVQRRSIRPASQDILGVLEQAAYPLLQLKQYAKAEALYREDIEARRALNSGADDAGVAMILFQLGDAYERQAMHSEAEPVLLQAAAIFRVPQNSTPQCLADTLRDLSDMYAATGRKEQAADALVESVEQFRLTVSPAGPELAAALAKIGLSLCELDAPAKAEPLFRESLSLREKLFPPDSPQGWRVASTRSMLGGSLGAQGRFEEAEPLLLGAYEALKDDLNVPPAPPGGSDRRQEALARIVRLYEAWDAAAPGAGHDADASKWRGVAAAGR